VRPSPVWLPGDGVQWRATVGWTEDPQTLARALADAGAPEGFGFIEPIDADPSAPNAITTYQVQDLWHHAPEYVRKRRNRELERQKRVAPSAKRRTTAPRGRRGQRSTIRARRARGYAEWPAFGTYTDHITPIVRLARRRRHFLESPSRLERDLFAHGGSEARTVRRVCTPTPIRRGALGVQRRGRDIDHPSRR